MVDKRDQQFFDGFMILVGIFVGIIAGVILLGHLVGDGEGMQGEEGAAHSALIERIEPIGAVALVGDPAPAQAAAPVMAAAAPAPAAAPQSGEQIYQQLCSACHLAGVAGAPMLSDAAAWQPRIAQGEAVLREHVINGFQGSGGIMPAKGGRADLSDDEVVSAMQYMLDQIPQ